MRESVLPDALNGKLRALMCEMNLAFGAIDLIRSPDGSYVFLEVNTVEVGWDWIEDSLKVPISELIARRLTNVTAHVTTPAVVEVREPDQPPQRVTVADSLVIGRECEGLIVGDAAVSRAHLRLTHHEGRLSVVDLGSRNGTRVNGESIGAEHALVAGDVVMLGQVEIEVISSGEPASRATEVPTATPAPQLRPALEALSVHQTDGAVIRFRPGTPGADAVSSVAAAVRRGRRRLAGLGSEPWGIQPQICLVDPFPDPAQPGELVTGGTLVDAARGEIWMVITPESPPEPVERPLALFFGASLPAAADIESLLEGYGLFAAELPNPDAELRGAELPALVDAEGPVARVARALVRSLPHRPRRPRRLRPPPQHAQPGRLDAAAQGIYGAVMANLEDAWRDALRTAAPTIKTGQFMRLALRYLRPHVRREVETALYMILGLAFTVVFPFALRRLLDSAIPSGEFGQVATILAALGAAFVVSLLASLRRTYLSAYVGASVVRQIRLEMFSKLQRLSSGWFDRREQGDVMSRLFNDVGLLEAGLSQTLREGAFQALSLVVATVVLLLLNPILTAVVLLGAPLVALIYRLMSAGARRRSVAVQEQIGGVFSIAAENYGAQSVVKAFGLEDRERGRFGQASDRLFRKQLSLQLFGGLFGVSVNMVVTVLRLLVLGLGSWLILEGHLTVGGLVAFVGLMGEVIGPVTVLTGIGQQIQASTGALVRINEVLDAEPAVQDEAHAVALAPLADSIRLADVSFSYTPERRTLEHLDVVIAAGSRVAFVGPTGAGKSSVLQLLMRFYDPDDGAVLFDGRDARTATVESLRRQLGVVFQETFLFDTTIRENIATGKPGATDGEIEAAARAAELHEFVIDQPRGYDTLVGERGSRLSGGQRQRVAIARALLRDPSVLLFDEATSALDARTERVIADTLHRIGEGRTTIAVTHRLASVTAYDRIFVVADGKIVEQGRHDELLKLDGLYAGLWAEQTGVPAAPEAPAPAVGPVGGQRLSRLTAGGPVVDAPAATNRPIEREVERLSGVLPAVRP